MDHTLPAAPWLMALAAVVAAAMAIGGWRALPWQGRQSVLAVSVALAALAVPATRGAEVLIGAVLLISAMLGTIGVRGTPGAVACCHRALVALVLAVCVFEKAATAPATAAATGHSGHGLTGVLSVIGIVGVIGVVLWTIAAAWFVEPEADRRTARLLGAESWAIAGGLAVACLAF